jgi:hypothetical protein
MDRRLRAFQAAALTLEGRILLARVHVPIVQPAPESSAAFSGSVWLKGAAQDAEALAAQPLSSSFVGTGQAVVQQGENATVWLERSALDGRLQVQVATDPLSPAVGVNLPAVNQTATFASGQNFTEDQTLTAVTIPTTAGAPNPGEVDVNLTITPIDPPPGLTVQGGPLELRILAPTAPPRIIGVAGTPDAIELTFSKPMNPVQASKVHNYAVLGNSTTILPPKGGFLGALVTVFSPDFGDRISKSTWSVPLRSANYDPADSTVTLVPKRRLTYTTFGSEIAVTQGPPAKTSARLRQDSSPDQGLTDLDGNAINQGGKPGKFRITVTSGYTPLF